MEGTIPKTAVIGTGNTGYAEAEVVAIGPCLGLPTPVRFRAGVLLTGILDPPSVQK